MLASLLAMIFLSVAIPDREALMGVGILQLARLTPAPIVQVEPIHPTCWRLEKRKAARGSVDAPDCHSAMGPGLVTASRLASRQPVRICTRPAYIYESAVLRLSDPLSNTIPLLGLAEEPSTGSPTRHAERASRLHVGGGAQNDA